MLCFREDTSIHIKIPTVCVICSLQSVQTTPDVFPCNVPTITCMSCFLLTSYIQRNFFTVLHFFFLYFLFTLIDPLPPPSSLIPLHLSRPVIFGTLVYGFPLYYSQSFTFIVLYDYLQLFLF